jgi:cellulose synthase/poly-beta-1,6-N-acetylglucosamine synthase-like glycosyltransferase
MSASSLVHLVVILASNRALSLAIMTLRRDRTAMATGAVLLAWPLAGYPACLRALARWRSRPVRPDPTAALPPLTVIVPSFNEEAEIEGRIVNLLESNYPIELLSIIVVDSASSDGTSDIARSVAKGRGCHVTVLEEPSRSGKASAINLGLEAARTDLVVLTDAPTRFAPDALRIVARCLSDPSVGAATGYFRIGAGDGPLGDEEARFWQIRNRLRTMEAEIDSTPFITGELCCFRRALVPSLHTSTLADDMDIALQVRRQGYRVVIDNDAIFTEARTGAARELLQTKSRRAAGGIQELFRGRDMFLRPRFGWYGMVVLPSAWSYYVPLRLPALGLIAYGLRRKRAGPAMAAATMTLGAAAALLAPSTRGKVLAQLRMLAFNEAVFVAAWWRVLTGSMDVKWAQERSTRGTTHRS